MLLSDPLWLQSRESAEQWFTVARLNFATLERLTALAFNAHKSAFEDAVAHARALLSAREPADLKANLAVAPEVQKALAHCRSLFDVSLQWQNEMLRVLQSHAALAAAERGCEALRLLTDMAGGMAEAGFTAAMEGLKPDRR